MTVKELLNMDYEDMPDAIEIDGYKFYKSKENFLNTIYVTYDGYEWTKVLPIMFDEEVTIIDDKPKKK